MRKKRALDVEKERFWRKLFGMFIRSTQQFKKFCEIEKISPNTFQYWRKELRRRDEERGVASEITKGDNLPSEFHEQARHWREILAALNEFEGSDRKFCCQMEFHPAACTIGGSSDVGDFGKNGFKLRN